MIAYVLTDGSYSDYGIVGIFTTREKAEAVKTEYATASIEEWEMDELQPKFGGCAGFSVSMDSNGNNRCYKQDADYAERCSKHDGVSVSLGRSYNIAPEGELEADFHILARDEEHAIKIANEKRLRMIAEGKWRAEE